MFSTLQKRRSLVKIEDSSPETVERVTALTKRRESSSLVLEHVFSGSDQKRDLVSVELEKLLHRLWNGQLVHLRL